MLSLKFSFPFRCCLLHTSFCDVRVDVWFTMYSVCFFGLARIHDREVEHNKRHKETKKKRLKIQTTLYMRWICKSLTAFNVHRWTLTHTHTFIVWTNNDWVYGMCALQWVGSERGKHTSALSTNEHKRKWMCYLVAYRSTLSSFLLFSPSLQIARYV